MVKKKGSYLSLIIILFAMVCFLTDYIIIDRNLSGNSVSDVVNSYEKYVKNMISERQSKFEDRVLYRSTVDSDIINERYMIELTKDGELSVEYFNNYESKVIATGVLNYYLINVGQESGKVLYFINEDGTVGKVSNIEYNHTSIDDISVEQKINNLTNIVTIVDGSFSEGLSGHRGPIFIDINGNIYFD